MAQDPNRGSDNASVAEYARLLSLAVHELRTPASVVTGYLRMLQGEASGPTTEHQRRMIEEAEKSCERLVAIINEMGEVARLDTGALPIRSVPTDLFGLLREVSADVRTAEQAPVDVRFRGTEAGAMCTADRARQGAAFSACMSAIAREQSDNATLVIETRLEDEDEGGARYALIVMSHTEAAPDLPERPRQPLNERRGGLGLALPLARRVVEAHGGLVWSPSAEAKGNEPVHTVILMRFPLT